MKDRLLDVVVESVSAVFGMMVPVPLEHVGVLQPPHTAFVDSVSAQVGFTGSHAGILSVHCSRALATCFTAAMLGDDEAQVYPLVEVEDAMGEIANMLGGAVKDAFSGGLDLTLSVPSVTSGDSYEFSAMRDPETVIAAFDSGAGQVLVGIKFKEARRQ